MEKKYDGLFFLAHPVYSKQCLQSSIKRCRGALEEKLSVVKNRRSQSLVSLCSHPTVHILPVNTPVCHVFCIQNITKLNNILITELCCDMYFVYCGYGFVSQRHYLFETFTVFDCYIKDYTVQVVLELTTNCFRTVN